MKGMALFGGNNKFKFGRRKKSKGENVITPTNETTNTSTTTSKKRDDLKSFLATTAALNPTSSTSSTSNLFSSPSSPTISSTVPGAGTEVTGIDPKQSVFSQEKSVSNALAASVKQDAKNKALHARLTKLAATDETGKRVDQTAYDEHMATVVPKGYTKKVIDKASEKVNLGTLQPDGSYKGGTPTKTNQGGSRETYTPIATNTRENAANQDMFNKANNNKSVTENYNPSEAIITQGNVVSDELKSYHEAQLKKAANKPKPVVEDTSQAALEKKYGLGSGQASSKMAAKNKSISTGKSSSGAEADISSVVSDIKGLGGKKDYFKK